MSPPLPPRILFVDDNVATCGPLAAALQAQGFEVQLARTGGEALGLARTRPDLIILDVLLPDVSGLEVCGRLKADPHTAAIPVLYLSGQFVSSDDRARGLDSGAEGYLVKPVEPRELLAQVNALLRAHRAEQALHASELRLADILDHAPVVVHLKDLQGHYLLVNHRWEALFGRGRAAVVGKTLHDIHPPAQADALRANDQAVLRSGCPQTFEEVVPHADGPHTYLSTKFVLREPDGSPCGVCGISVDITGRKKIEESLRDAEALYESLVETLPVCIFRKDLDGRFTFANRPFCAELRRPPEQVLGRTDHDFYPEALAHKYASDDRRVLATGVMLEDVEEHPTPEGGISYVRVLKAPVPDARGRTIGVQGVFWDVTARRQAEEELARTLAELRVARRIQQRLFPTAAPLLASGLPVGFDLGGASYPAEAIGGDYYDYLALPDGSLAVAVGDVSGHGIGPALLMALARAYLHACAGVPADVGTILARVNRLLVPDMEGDRYLTLLLAQFDPRARQLVYASAGHTPGYVLDAAGAVKRTLESTGMPLGISPEVSIGTSAAVPLHPGDLVLFLTDGVTEARDPSGHPFGAQRALDVVRVYRQASAGQVVENLYHAVRAFTHNAPQRDDITATVIKVRPAPGGG
jgi:PAS domain S-box-containing protein